MRDTPESIGCTFSAVWYYPTIYVLDARGVIRHEDLRGEKLEKGVNALLDEQAKRTSAPVAR
jgi:hypothetical protein